MKRFLPLSVFLISFVCHGQYEVFHENFDLPSGADSVVQGSSGSATWNDTNFVYVSPTQSFHLQAAAGDTVFFETSAFSTVGKPYVLLEFSHIAKISSLHQMRIKVSIDNGNNWSTLGSNSYMGSSAAFSSGFNSDSYPDTWVSSDPNAVPNNSWWKKEAFDLTDLASDMTTLSGYPNVKIRFEGRFSSGAIVPHGWFVDNLVVKAAACDFIPPVISFDYHSFPCYQPNPQGFMLTTSSNEYDVGAMVHDPGSHSTGIDSVAMFYRINGGPLIGKEMPLTASEYRTIIPAQPGDVVEYYVIAADNGCPGTTRRPASGFFEFMVIPAPPSKCGGTHCGKSPDLIQSFPWKEDFEGPHWVVGNPNSGSPRGSIPSYPDGAWVTTPQTVMHNYGWTVATGPTPTPLTGPSGDNTTGNGKYVYAEFSPYTGSGAGVTTLQTPCIDLRDSVARIFSFNYHMYGQDINKLWVGIDTGSSGPAWWDTYHKISGPQQGSPTEPWKQASISLEPFVGKFIRIRFLTLAKSGSSDLQDIAIDDLLIKAAAPNDLALADITSPGTATCTPGTNDSVSITVVNHGLSSPTVIPAAYQLSGGAVVRDTFNAGNLALMDTTQFTFSHSLGAQPSSPHALKVWLEPAIENNRKNDSLDIHIPIRQNAVIDSFPYHFGFENASAGGLGNLNDRAWNLDSTATGNEARWTIASGVYNNSLQGPLQGLGKNKNFLLLRDGNASLADEASFTSSCIDLSNLSAPKLNFHYYLEQGQRMQVMIKRLGEHWETLHLISGSSSERRFQSHSISLSAFAGDQVQLGFKVGFALSASHFTAALDNIVIQEDDFDDFAILAISDSIHLMTEGSNRLPSLKIYASDSGNVQYGVQLINKCGSGTTYQAGTAISTSADSATTAPSLNFSTSLSAGRYDFKAWLNHSNDHVRDNDTLYGETEVLPVRSAPYLQDFEACSKDFTTVGGNKQWEVGTPAKAGITAHSGTQSAITNVDANYTSTDQWEYLYSPVFRGLDTLAGAEVRFWHRYAFGSGSGVVEINQSGTWENLTKPTIPGSNWSRLMSPSQKGSAFAGTSTGWIYSGYPLESLSGSQVQFRFAATAPISPGWAIDDFEIFVPAQNSAAPLALIFDTGMPRPGVNNLGLKVANTGARDLQNLQISVYLDGTQIFTEQKSLPAVDPGSDDILQLQNTLNMPLGVSELMVITSRPNHREDDLPADDTLIMQVNVPHTVTSSNYCNDFENDAAFASLDLKSFILDSLWQNTDPSKTIFSPAHSGTASWVTGKSASYPPFLDNALYTPPFQVKGKQCYQFSFWHQYDTEQNFDGGNVEYSLDSGKTWNVLGPYTDSTWYNTPHVQSLDQVKPGFSGNSGGWVESWTIQEFDTAGAVSFRFRFASNATVNGEGWAIDDICFKELNESCDSASSIAEQNQLRDMIQLFPNPAFHSLHLSLENAAFTTAAVPVSIIDQSGRVVRQWEQELHAGHKSTIDIQALAKGIYSLKIDFQAEHVVKTFIKM